MSHKIIIVRHGETQYNVERRLQGWLDIPLNKEGISQAKAVGNRLKNERPIAIYCSDHSRTFTTAEHIASHHGLKPIKAQELREDYLGIFEGWQWEVDQDADKLSKWQARDEARLRGDLNFTVGDSESLGSHLTRVSKVLQSIEERHEGSGTIIIVTHGGTINRIMEHYKFKQIGGEYISYKNTSITIINNINGEYQLELDNDISHLNINKG